MAFLASDPDHLIIRLLLLSRGGRRVGRGRLVIVRFGIRSGSLILGRRVGRVDERLGFTCVLWREAVLGMCIACVCYGARSVVAVLDHGLIIMGIRKCVVRKRTASILDEWLSSNASGHCYCITINAVI